MSMSFHLSESAKRIIELICLAAVAVMFVIGVAVYGAPAGSLMILMTFLIVYVQLPGLLFVRITKMNNSHISTDLAIGVFLGWAFNILIYFISDLIRGEFLLLIAGPVAALAYIYIRYKDKQQDLGIKRINIENISLSVFLFMTVVVFYCLLNTQYLYLTPSLNDLTYMNPDKAYHMGLINSLSHDYPLQSPWISGVTITYHIFSEMLLSIPVRLFGVESDVVTQSFGPYLTAYVFGVSYYSFFRELSSKPNRAGIYCLLVILANIYVTRKLSTSIAFKFALANDNSSGYGIAAVLVGIITFKKWYEAFTERSDNRHALLLMLTLIVMLATGIKGPMGAVAVAGLWGTVILGIILRKIPLKTLAPLVLVTAGFLLVYVIILGSKGQANASGNPIIALAKISDIAFWKKPMVDALKAIGIPRTIILAMVFAVFMVFFTTVYFVPFCLGYLRELFLVLTRRKEYEPVRVLVYADCFVGLLAMFLLNYSGRSQIYFGLVSVFLVPIIAYWFIEDMEELRDKSNAAKNALRISVTALAVTMVATSLTLVEYFGRHVDDAISNAKPTTDADMYYSISNEEYDAMEWIKDNTEKDALLAADRYYSVDPQKYSYENRWDNRFFLYGVYSNRFLYISGSGYNMRQADWPMRKEMIETNEKLYDKDNSERGNLARKLGVDYVVVSKRFSGDIDLENEDYKRCYSNDDVDVYKISE